MCLSIPGKVVRIEGELATVSIGGSLVETSTALVDDVKPGEYVLVHSGFALQRISDEEARETLRLIEELGEMPDFQHSEAFDGPAHSQSAATDGPENGEPIQPPENPSAR